MFDLPSVLQFATLTMLSQKSYRSLTISPKRFLVISYKFTIKVLVTSYNSSMEAWRLILNSLIIAIYGNATVMEIKRDSNGDLTVIPEPRGRRNRSATHRRIAPRRILYASAARAFARMPFRIFRYARDLNDHINSKHSL